MNDQYKRDIESSKDASPLNLEQLSDTQLEHILQIEQRLGEAKGISYDVPSRRQNIPGGCLREPYFACVQDRYARVLLLDGDRGTGKTSLLLTLVRKWHSAAGLDGEPQWAAKDLYDERVKRIQQRSPDLRVNAPTNIRVLKIIDFDPLPPEMPLIAGIVQTLHPLAERYDPAGSDDDWGNRPTLEDLWHKLFRIATLAWSEIPKRSGLIEQLLDREEQVRDWQQVAEHWQGFVGEILYRGKCIKDPDKLSDDDDTVLVIMIDDVDLQVARVRQLLPALRLLYHPRVFFLVAADRQHMIDMLELDYAGQQAELARGARSFTVPQAKRWPQQLARSAFEKVFPTRNHWKMERLSLLEFLDFPGPSYSRAERSENVTSRPVSGEKTPKTFREFLEDIPKPSRGRSDMGKGDSEENGDNSDERLTVGKFIMNFANLAQEIKLPGVMTYRAARQLYQYVIGLSPNGLASAQVLARLLSGTANQIQAPNNQKPEGPSSLLEVAVEVSVAGELASLYRRGRSSYAGSYEIVLSASPDFVFSERSDASPRRMSSEPSGGFNYTSALIAKMLEEADYNVDATSLRWDTYVSLAWTEWQSLGLSFSWTRHVHPRPDQLLSQTQDWSESMKKMAKASDNFDQYAYAWVYLQRKWSVFKVPDALAPTKKVLSTTLPWDILLDIGTEPEPSNERRTEWRRWYAETLPLLARPELGFPSEVQKKLLDRATIANAQVKSDLKNKRRRLVTDAFVAARAQKGFSTDELPKDEQVENLIGTIDRQYEDRESANWWADKIESGKKKLDSSTRAKR